MLFKKRCSSTAKNAVVAYFNFDIVRQLKFRITKIV